MREQDDINNVEIRNQEIKRDAVYINFIANQTEKKLKLNRTSCVLGKRIIPVQKNGNRWKYNSHVEAERCEILNYVITV